MSHSKSPWLVACAVTILTAACGGHSASPTGPSGDSVASLAPATPAASSGATISGNIAGASVGAFSLTSRTQQTTGGAGVRVSVTGTDIFADVDIHGSFTLLHVPSIEVVLRFVGPGVDATLPVGAVGPTEEVHLVVNLGPTTATIETEQHTTENETVELEGKIESLDYGLRRLQLGGVTVDVPSDAVIRRGDSPIGMTDLRPGERAHVRGRKDGQTVRASEVKVTPDPPAPPSTPPPSTSVTFSGQIAGVTGACPNLTIKIGDLYVRTSAATSFPDEGCDDAEAGENASGVGTKQADGTVLASRVELSESHRPVTVTFSGQIVGVTGACPTLTMKIGDTYVRTDASTVFPGKGCGDAKVGDTASGFGVKNDGVVLASKLTLTAAPPPPPPPPTVMTFSGTVIGVSGACPSITLKAGDTYVRTNASTEFPASGCGDVKVGSQVGGRGTKTDGVILATRMEVH